MGLGKTLQAISIAYYYKSEWPLLIIVPSSLRYPWIEELERWFPEIHPHDINLIQGGGDVSGIGTSLISVVTYGLLRHPASKVVREALLNQKFKVAIVDESHYLKNRKSATSKYLVPLIQMSQRRLLLTGTPALARPEELFPQLSALMPKEFPSFGPFANRYCDAHNRYIGKMKKWVTDGASNLEELQNVLTEKVMIRRLKKDVLHQLPPKQRQRIAFSIKESDMKKDLDSTWNDLHSVLDHNKVPMAKALEKTSDDPPGSAWFEIMKNMSQLYHKTCDVKLGPVKEYVKMLCENRGLKFIIFAYHHVMMNSLSEQLHDDNIKFIRIDGSTPQQDRPRLVHQFQVDTETRVAILSIKAAGVGLTLTAAKLVVFAELDWTPGAMEQCEDRAHRIGQKDTVHVHYLVAKGTLDDWVWSALARKTSVVTTTLNGKTQVLKMDDGNQGQIDCLANADAYKPPENSHTEITDFFKSQQPKDQSSIYDFFTPKGLKPKKKGKAKLKGVIDSIIIDDDCANTSLAEFTTPKTHRTCTKLDSFVEEESVITYSKQERNKSPEKEDETNATLESEQPILIETSEPLLSTANSVPDLLNSNNKIPLLTRNNENDSLNGSDDKAEIQTTTWSCSACTFINHLDLPCCEICNTPKRRTKRTVRKREIYSPESSPRSKRNANNEAVTPIIKPTKARRGRKLLSPTTPQELTNSVDENIELVGDKDKEKMSDQTENIEELSVPGTDQSQSYYGHESEIPVLTPQKNGATNEINDYNSDSDLFENTPRTSDSEDLNQSINHRSTGAESSCISGIGSSLLSSPCSSTSLFSQDNNGVNLEEELPDIYVPKRRRNIKTNDTKIVKLTAEAPRVKMVNCTEATVSTYFPTDGVLQVVTPERKANSSPLPKSIMQDIYDSNYPGPSNIQLTKVESLVQKASNSCQLKEPSGNQSLFDSTDTLQQTDKSSDNLDEINSTPPSDPQEFSDQTKMILTPTLGQNSCSNIDDVIAAETAAAQLLFSPTRKKKRQDKEKCKQLEWVCPECDMLNEEDTEDCEGCLSSRPTEEGKDCKQAVDIAERKVNLDEVPVYNLLKFCCSQNTSRIYLYDQDNMPLNVNFTPLDVEVENYSEFPDLLLHPENMKLVKRFVREWNSLSATKRRVIIKSEEVFISPCLIYEQVKQKPKQQTNKRHLTKEEVSAAAISKAEEIGGSVRTIIRPKISPKKKRKRNNLDNNLDMENQEQSIQNNENSSNDDNIMEKLKGVTQVLDSSGNPLCVSCHKRYENELLTGLTIKENPWHTRFCSKPCMHQYWVRSCREYGVDQVFSEEHGICQLCQFQAHEFFLRIKNTCDLRKRAQLIKDSIYNVLNPESKEKMVKKPTKGLFWEVDHINPVSLGGGQCDIDNLRTLCTPCHRQVTAQQSKDRAKRRKLEKAAACGDITAFFQPK